MIIIFIGDVQHAHPPIAPTSPTRPRPARGGRGRLPPRPRRCAGGARPARGSGHRENRSRDLPPRRGAGRLRARPRRGLCALPARRRRRRDLRRQKDAGHRTEGAAEDRQRQLPTGALADARAGAGRGIHPAREHRLPWLRSESHADHHGAEGWHPYLGRHDRLSGELLPTPDRLGRHDRLPARRRSPALRPAARRRTQLRHPQAKSRGGVLPPLEPDVGQRQFLLELRRGFRHGRTSGLRRLLLSEAGPRLSRAQQRLRALVGKRQDHLRDR